MKQYICPFILFITLSSCAVPRLAVPEKFKEVSEQLHVKGVNGFLLNQKLHFGAYNTTKVKRGWTSTRERSSQSVDQRLLQVFGNVESYNSQNKQQNRYHYSLDDGQQSLQLFCREKFTREEMNVNTNTKVFGVLSKTQRSAYDFTAAIIPEADTAAPWQLVMHSDFDRAKDTARGIFDLPYKEEEGFVSNGRERIDIRPLRVKNMITRKGKESRFPIKVLSGYELRIEEGVIAVIDILGHNLWLYKELDDDTKRLVAAVCSALMLRQLQDTNA